MRTGSFCFSFSIYESNALCWRCVLFALCPIVEWIHAAQCTPRTRVFVYLNKFVDPEPFVFVFCEI